MTITLFSEEEVRILAEYSELRVGYSGGVDSTVLLHALAQYPSLKQRLKAIHVHHGLSPYADAWAVHCQQVCLEWGIAFECVHIQLSCHHNIEEEARDKRYDVLLRANGCLFLAHHQDDQCETVLLRLCRGTGIKGSGGMKSLTLRSGCKIMRPLLKYSKQDLERYAEHHCLRYICDESNNDIRFARNYLRQSVIPLLKHKWPDCVAKVAQFAVHAQGVEEDLTALGHYDYPGLDHRPLDLHRLSHLPWRRQMNVIRIWFDLSGKKMPSMIFLNELKKTMIDARADNQAVMTVGQDRLRLYRGCLLFEDHQGYRPEAGVWHCFPEPLCLGTYQYHAKVLPPADDGLWIPNQADIEIRFRQGGEQFYDQGHHRCLKKWFQAQGIPAWWRDKMPLFFVNGELLAILCPDGLRLKQSLDFYAAHRYDSRMDCLNYGIYVTSL